MQISDFERTALKTAILFELATRRLVDYSPYAKQREFHAAGSLHRERLLMAGNQLGKSWSGAAEMAMHLTGRYPEWWRGRKWDRPISAWGASVSGIATRDNVQRLLLGRIGQPGTGMIPPTEIAGVKQARGVADLVDTVMVRHASGGTSTLTIKTYDQGRERWQGDTVDLVWFDEEPDEAIYFEGLTRTNATKGMAYMTFTPLLGMSEVVMRFLNTPSDDRHVTTMTIDDAEHYTQDERDKIIAGYPAHEREARANGIPTLGSGLIFPVTEESFVVDPFKIPDHWKHVAGIDFGWDHPTGAAKLAYDADNDVVYVTSDYRESEQTPVIHSAALKSWGDWFPWAWPHDGLQHDKGSGDQLSEIYRRNGLAMLPERATWSDGSNSVEAGVQDILERMQTGRWKVFSNCQAWLNERRMYHRKDGKIIKERDDVISASRYAYMMLRFAVPKRERVPEWRKALQARNRASSAAA